MSNTNNATTVFGNVAVGGPDTGISSTNSEAPVSFTRAVDVSAGAQSHTITLPDNSFISDIKGAVTAAVSAATDVIVGDTADSNKYGTMDVSAASVVTATLAVGIVSAKEVTIQTSAAFTEGKVTVFITGGTYR